MAGGRRDLLQYLRDMRWRDVDLSQRASAASTAKPVVAEALFERPPTEERSEERLRELAAIAATCRRCGLAETRTRVVFGVGNPRARVMFVGEAPGADEDAQGEPFVGQAGQLLTAMLRAIGLDRKDVYIANIVKCRPPKNRDPEPEEAAACLGYLRRQIELVNPTVIVLLGRVAVRFLLGLSGPITALRGTWREWEGRQVLLTFHPAYLLRYPSAKAQVWRDLQQLRSVLQSNQ